MPEKVFENIVETELELVVDYLISMISPAHILTFSGDLGAGKTTLIKKIVKALGSEDAVSSPTFSLVNEYRAKNGEKIVHSDWYRIKSLEELYDAGMEEYFDDENAIFLLEWPEVGDSMLRGMPVIRVKIKHLQQGRNYRIYSKN